MKSCQLLTPVCLLLSTGAWATDNLDSAQRDGKALEVGVMADIRQTDYRGYDDSTRPLPILTFNTRWFYADGTEVGFKALDSGPHRIGAFLSVSTEQWDASDSDDFKSFEDKDMAIHAGISYRYRAHWGIVKIRGFTDASNEHDGNGASIDYVYPWHATDRVTLIPTLRYKYQDDDYANYYYGVSNRDAATSPLVGPYDTGSASKWTLGVMGKFMLAEQWFLYAGGFYTMLDSDLEDSPIMDGDTESRINLGVSYRF